RQVGTDRPAAGRLAADGHLRRVTAEPGDIPVYPGQRRLLVHQAVVARLPVRAGQRRVGEEPEDAQPVVDGHHDDTGGVHDEAAVVLVRAAVGQPAAVDPEVHRQPGAGADSGRALHIEVQAVLRLGAGPVGAGECGAPVAVRLGVAYSRPG